MDHSRGRVRGKVVLVTGSTTGIGEATARLAVAEGARVMVHGLEEDLAKKVCQDLGQDHASYFICDIGDPENCVKLVHATVQRFGRIDVVVNNAALVTRSTLDSTDCAMFDRIISVNLRAPMLIIREAVKHFKTQGGGTVLNIGSVNSLGGQADLLAYSTSKSGLIGMTRNLANSLATEKIRVNLINPGWVTSANEIALQQRLGMPEGWEKNVPKFFAPTGKLLTPEDVARHVIFWISDDSAPANGAVYELEQYSIVGRNPDKVT
jgi:NAD(P)-dependent dehydrogenase (short-subunit alcohol dehydrogenase family)